MADNPFYKHKAKVWQDFEKPSANELLLSFKKGRIELLKKTEVLEMTEEPHTGIRGLGVMIVREIDDDTFEPIGYVKRNDYPVTYVTIPKSDIPFKYRWRAFRKKIWKAVTKRSFATS